jgi:cytoskeletal protein RodZ
MNSIDTTMTNTKGLMLSMLAIGGLFVGGAFMAQAQAQPFNIASSSNEDNDDVRQSNYADVTQKSKIKCNAEAESENDDSLQVGGNTNIAANDCDSTQTSYVTQTNANIDDDVQIASADACQSFAGLLGFNVC